jgi:hypothetical protein
MLEAGPAVLVDQDLQATREHACTLAGCPRLLPGRSAEPTRLMSPAMAVTRFSTEGSKSSSARAPDQVLDLGDHDA